MSCATRVVRPESAARRIRVDGDRGGHRAGRRRRHPDEVEPTEGAARARRQANALARAALRRRSLALDAGRRARSRPRPGRASSWPIPTDLPPVVTAIQDQQLGTGHACACALEVTGTFTGTVLVTYGDVPLLRTGNPQRTRRASTPPSGNAVTVLTAMLPDPTGYGRIIRGESGEIVGIVEQKDADVDSAGRFARSIPGSTPSTAPSCPTRSAGCPTPTPPASAT